MNMIFIKYRKLFQKRNKKILVTIKPIRYGRTDGPTLIMKELRFNK